MKEPQADQGGRLVVVSNRLPVVIGQEEGQWRIRPGSGGLITALAPIIKHNRGVWIGWPGCGDEAPLAELLPAFSQEQQFELETVLLDADEVEKFYAGFSNATLWPLFHDLLGHCQFSLENWQAYDRVNRRYAEAVIAAGRPEDFIWVHDYQLALVAAHLRRLGFRHTLAFFLHTPFPSLDLFRRLPWRHEIIRGLMEYDLLGFQTLRDRRNFVNCANSLIPEVEVITRQSYRTLLRYGERVVKVGHFPISIDFHEFNEAAQSKEVAEAAWYLHEKFKNQQILLGIDRLDYTKGIPDRFLAFERALEKYPQLKQKVSLLQVVIPSRTLVPDYQNLKELLDQLAGRINARFSEAGWIPIHYVFRSLDRVQLLAHYRAAEIALITPLRDGMNLVAKEYCAASVEDNGVLILSEFAGAADDMGRLALLVNPYDIDGTADALWRAVTMEPEERQRRMRLLRTQIRRNDVHRWVRRFMETLYGAKASKSLNLRAE